MTHEAYTEISEQVDDALSGCTHLMTWIQECAKFSPVDPSKTLSKGIKSATGRDRAIPYSLAMGMAETSLLQHLEAEQAFFGKVKQNVLEPIVTLVNTNKKSKANIDKKMRDLVSKIMNGKRKLASDKNSCLKELEEYKVCLADPSSPANVKKLPNAKKKVVQSVTKYEQAVAALTAVEKEYNEQIPIETNALHTLERNRLAEIDVRLKVLSQLMLERSQDMIASRARLESYVAQLPSAESQHNKLNAQWNNKFGNTPANQMVQYDMPVTSQLLEDAKDLSVITSAEDSYSASRSKMDSIIQATNLHFTQIQQQIDADDKASLTQLNQQAQASFKTLTEQYGHSKAQWSGNSSAPKHSHVLSKDMRDESKLGSTADAKPEGSEEAGEEDDSVLSPNANTTMEEKQKMVAEVQKLFSSANFVAEGRYFVKRGTLTKKCRSKDQDYEFFLFNDMLVYGSKPTGSRKLRVHKMLSIDAAFTVTDLPPKSSIKQDFAIQCTGKSFVVTAASQQEKSAWVADLAVCCEARKNVNVEAKSDAAPVFRQDGERDHCPFCKRGFGAFRRKHHCRKCGELCCADCSPSKIVVGGVKPERVCIKCNPEYQIEKKKMEEVARKAAGKAPPKPAAPNAQPKPASTTTTTTTTTGNTSPATEASPAAATVTPTVTQQQPAATTQPEEAQGDVNAYNDQGAWIAPPEAAEKTWMESRDSTSGAKYWYNTQTQTSVWVKPEGVADEDIAVLDD